MEGYIKIHRQILDSPYFTDAETYKFWSWLLITASYKKRSVNLSVKNGSIVTVNLLPGDLIFGRKSAAKTLKINESKVERLLKKFLNDKSIVRKPNTNFSIISICNYASYQIDIIDTEHQTNTKRTPNEHQTNTYNKDKNNISKDIFNGLLNTVIEYLNEKTGRAFLTDNIQTVKAIKARFSEGRKVEDFFAVIDTKSLQWGNTEMRKHLIPSTLFGNKFANYLEESQAKIIPLEPLAKGAIDQSQNKNLFGT